MEGEVVPVALTPTEATEGAEPTEEAPEPVVSRPTSFQSLLIHDVVPAFHKRSQASLEALKTIETEARAKLVSFNKLLVGYRGVILYRSHPVVLSVGRHSKAGLEESVCSDCSLCPRQADRKRGW